MARLFSAVLLYLLAVALAAFFLVQLLFCAGAHLGIQWWPVFITGLWALAVLVWPADDRPAPAPVELSVVSPRPAWQRQLPPPRWRLQLSSLLVFGLSPFWAWLMFSVNLSSGNWNYFSLMALMDCLVLLWMMLEFSCQVRQLSLFRRSQWLLTLTNWQVVFWLYLAVVPFLAVQCCTILLSMHYQWGMKYLPIQMINVLVGEASVGKSVGWLLLGLLAYSLFAGIWLLCSLEDSAPVRAEAVSGAAQPKEVPADQGN